MIRDGIARNRNGLISFFLGVGGSMCFPWILKVDEAMVGYTNSFFTIFLAMISVVSIHYMIKQIDVTDKRGALCAVLFSVMVSLSLVWGKQLDTVENVNIGDGKMWIAILILTAYFTIFVRFFMGIVDNFVKEYHSKRCYQEHVGQKEEKQADSRDKKISKKEIFLTWLGLLLCWLPVFLAFYPGAFVYDAQDEYVQVATREFTTHHPLIHVLLLGGSLAFGNKYLDSYNIGIAIYTIAQMMVLAACFTYLLLALKRYGIAKVIRIISFLFLGFFPIVPMYAVCSAKDTLFTAAVTLVFILIVEYHIDGERFQKQKWYTIGFVVVSIFMMLLRNNGAYAYMVLIPILIIGQFFAGRKKSEKVKWKTYFLPILMVSSYILFMIVSSLLTNVLDATHGNKQEILTVPIQQLARTYQYAPESFTAEEKETLYEIIAEEDLETYVPNISDIIKTKFSNEAYLQNSAKYQQLWAKIGMKNPMTYINAWLLTSYGYWYPDTIINVYGGIQRFTFQYQDSSYFGFETELPGTRESKFPALEEFYRKLSLEIYQQKVPVISMMFSPGFMCFLYVFLGIFLLWKKQYGKMAPMMLVYLILGTVMLGPTYLVRYVLMFWFLLPMAISLPLLNRGIRE